MEHIIPNDKLPPILRSMARCRSCGYFYSDEWHGPHGQCRICFWGLPPEKDKAITRMMVVFDLARVAEELMAVREA